VDCGLIFVAESFWLNPASWWAMLQVLFGLGAVIFVHELGHFLVAKACGVKCEKFYVGFDAFDIKIGDRVIIPRSLIKKQIGETEYGIGLLPFGGYVKMLGQDDNPTNLDIENSVRSGHVDKDGNPIVGQAEAAGLQDKSQIDPRSFRAKSVPQRMAIISAGVIFNLLFAVLFAAIAFKAGVDYEPPTIGNVVGGGPAWENNLLGADVKRINSQEINDEVYFRYLDMAQEIVFNGDETPIEFEVIPYGESESKVVKMLPSAGLNRGMMELPMVGIRPRANPEVAKNGVIEGSAASSASVPLLGGDVVTKINGEEIKTDLDMRFVLNKDFETPATFELKRNVGTEDEPKYETVTSVIPPNPMRRAGISVKWLPVTAIQKQSPAEKAGLQVGDEIVAIGGESRGNLMTFDRRMIKQVRENPEELELEILRNAEPMTLKITPIIPQVLSVIGPNRPIALDTLGAAVGLTAEVESVEAGSPAEMAGFQSGDVLESVKYILTETQRENDIYKGLHEKVVNFVDDETTWAEVLLDTMQRLSPETILEFEVVRGEKKETLSLTTVASDELFLATRGVFLTGMEKHYQSKTLGDAFKLGARQVWEDTRRVGKFLGKLITGKVSAKNLGGPGTIALVATSEASKGTSSLLLFLTLLSANLAIVNFLPIPILDGGHMLFLIYEGLFRRPVSQRVEILLMYGGLIFILGLMAFVVWQDIGRIGSLL